MGKSGNKSKTQSLVEEEEDPSSSNSPLTSNISQQSSLFSRLRSNFNSHPPNKSVVKRFMLPKTIFLSSSANYHSEYSRSPHMIHRTNSRCCPMPNKSVLKEADKFEYDINKQVPTIYRDEFILPGSSIQKNMAMTMKLNINEDQCDDECVICLDLFTSSNPRMPTLCGCGKNKAPFHLPCLYQWIEQDKNCPVCRKLLRWEEF